ncbi:CLUMA_CG014703, isoform A [Clunio marinus]|uniref:CLUMA_CG014703, isoform A n=1 Tax=Clunio marinus TaxID=568069 RepID=A0A1J1ILL7_9DIPT|nr:CLUMA_CG014703, isoform A [Clunio marinus]
MPKSKLVTPCNEQGTFDVHTNGSTFERENPLEACETNFANLPWPRSHQDEPEKEQERKKKRKICLRCAINKTLSDKNKKLSKKDEDEETIKRKKTRSRHTYPPTTVRMVIDLRTLEQTPIKQDEGEKIHQRNQMNNLSFKCKKVCYEGIVGGGKRVLNRFSINIHCAKLTNESHAKSSNDLKRQKNDDGTEGSATISLAFHLPLTTSYNRDKTRKKKL